MSNGTYERIKIFCDTLPLRQLISELRECFHMIKTSLRLNDVLLISRHSLNSEMSCRRDVKGRSGVEPWWNLIWWREDQRRQSEALHKRGGDGIPRKEGRVSSHRHNFWAAVRARGQLAHLRLALSQLLYLFKGFSAIQAYSQTFIWRSRQQKMDLPWNGHWLDLASLHIQDWAGTSSYISFSAITIIIE